MKWNLTKRANENPIDNFHKSIDAIFDDFLSFKPTGLFESEWLPRIDVTEDSKAVHVKAEIPGIEEKDLNITLNGNILTISGEKKEEKKRGKGQPFNSVRALFRKLQQDHYSSGGSLFREGQG